MRRSPAPCRPSLAGRSLSRRGLLAAAVAAGVVPFVPGRAAAPTPRRKLVVVWAQGGWDVTYVFDPKLGVGEIEGPEYFANPNDPDDVDEVREFGGLRVLTNDLRRPSVTTFFEQQHARTAIVNGIWVGSIAHDPCRVRMLTGTTLQTSADVVTISGATYGTTSPLGSIDMSGVGFTGSLAATAGSIGGSSQITTLLDPRQVFDPAPGAPAYPQFLPTDADTEALRAQQLARHAALVARRGSDPRLVDFVESMSRSSRLDAEAATLIDALKLGTTPSFFTMLDLGTDLLQQDVCSAVLVDTRMRWDSHIDNSSQNPNFQTLFAGLTQLANQLDAKGLAEDTTVVVLSEMTRTPRHNVELGKDHWQHTSALLFGAKVRPGQYGATDDLLESLPMDLATGEPTERGELCQYSNFVAGLLSMLDIDPGPHLPNVTPFRGAAQS